MSALNYKGYICTPDAAVQDSYLLNLAQGAVEMDRTLTGEILADYCDGDISLEAACEQLEGLAQPRD